MRLDRARLIDRDSTLTQEIAKAFPDADGFYQGEACEDAYPHPEAGDLRCTRPRQHDGPHVSHDDVGPRAIWPKEGR